MCRNFWDARENGEFTPDKMLVCSPLLGSAYQHMSCAKSLLSCLILCDPMEHSLARSSVHGILQARILEWVAWDSPGKNTGVGCHALLQGIFLTQGWNPHFLCLLHWQAWCSSPLMPPGKSPNINTCTGWKEAQKRVLCIIWIKQHKITFEVSFILSFTDGYIYLVIYKITIQCQTSSVLDWNEQWYQETHKIIEFLSLKGRNIYY